MMESLNPLSGAQDEMNDAFEHQYGRNNELRIVLMASTRRRFWHLILGMNSRLFTQNISEPL